MVESMFSLREVPWHGLGTIVQDAPSSIEALRIAGLDWKVEQIPLYSEINGVYQAVPNTFGNRRSSDNSILGVVSERYKIVQNEEAFAFTDALLGAGAVYETAGSLFDGKRVWLLAKLPSISLLDEETNLFLLFSNSFDASSPVRVSVTPIRVVCNNTLNLALRNVKRQWKMKHCASINDKMVLASETLQLTNKYTTALEAEAFNLYGMKLTDAEVKSMVEKLFPMSKEFSEKQTKNREADRENFLVRYNFAPDVQRFKGTGWGFIQAATDYAGHQEPRRETENYKANRFADIIDGHKLVDAAYELVMTA
jgi:phage/plasmid-like protein (TIGR03299 family)